MKEPTTEATALTEEIARELNEKLRQMRDRHVGPPVLVDQALLDRFGHWLLTQPEGLEITEVRKVLFGPPSPAKATVLALVAAWMDKVDKVCFSTNSSTPT